MLDEIGGACLLRCPFVDLPSNPNRRCHRQPWQETGQMLRRKPIREVEPQVLSGLPIRWCAVSHHCPPRNHRPFNRFAAVRPLLALLACLEAFSIS
jgi:hypothetical protein